MIKREAIPRAQWRAICNAWGGRCAYCGKASARLQADHVEAVSTGGSGDLDNVVPACRDCNSSKRDHPLLTWLLREGAPSVRRTPPDKIRHAHMIVWTPEQWTLIKDAAALYQKREYLRMNPSRLIRAVILNWAKNYIAEPSSRKAF